MKNLPSSYLKNLVTIKCAETKTVPFPVMTDQSCATGGYIKARGHHRYAIMFRLNVALLTFVRPSDRDHHFQIYLEEAKRMCGELPARLNRAGDIWWFITEAEAKPIGAPDKQSSVIIKYPSGGSELGDTCRYCGVVSIAKH